MVGDKIRFPLKQLQLSILHVPLDFAFRYGVKYVVKQKQTFFSDPMKYISDFAWYKHSMLDLAIHTKGDFKMCVTSSKTSCSL